MNNAMPELQPGASDGEISFYNNIALASFLAGGMVGGVLFGVLGDRIGRTKTMILTILMYSCFTCVTMFAQTWWHMAVLRFLVAMGVGGGFCFNVGRIIAAPILILAGWVQRDWGYSLEQTASLFSFLFLLAVVVLFFAPETKGRRLPT